MANDAVIIDHVKNRGRPSCGECSKGRLCSAAQGFPPDYFVMMKKCWHQEPGKRPAFFDIVERLRAMLPPRR
jgi:hypothetical protein